MPTIEDIVLSQLPSSATYQQDIATGKQALSGADLKGEARRWGCRYAESRRAVVRLWRVAGGHIRRGPHGRLTLESGDIPATARRCSCSMGECWAY